jgi:hypothetical protein
MSYLDPLLKQDFSEADDRTIERLVREIGPQWVQIGRMLGNKSGIVVRNRHRYVQRLLQQGRRPTYAEHAQLFDDLFVDFSDFGLDEDANL